MKTVVAMLLFIVLTTLQITLVSGARCIMNFGAQSCRYSGNELTMTYPIMLRVSNAPAGISTFNANVILKGGIDDGTIIPESHPADGSDATINIEHMFNPYDTINYMGYTVTFEPELECGTSFHEKYFSITMVGGGLCIIDNTVDISEIPDGTFIDDDDNTSIVTSTPTTGAVENSNPPTIGSTPPPITAIDTTTPPSSMNPTLKPSLSPIMVIIPLIPTTTSPTYALSTLKPSSDSTSSQSSPAPSNNVIGPSLTSSCTMQLVTAEYMDRDAKQTWIDVTQKTIQDEVASQLSIPTESVIVAITITKQEKIPSESRRRRRKLQQQQQRRNLQSPSTSPLSITFSTVITFPSTTAQQENEEWNVIDLVGGGFNSIKEQEYYISQLVSTDEYGDFDNVNSMTLIVDGKTVTDEVSNNTSSSPFTIPMIVGAAVGGISVLLLSVVFFIFYRRKQKKKSNNDHGNKSSYPPKSFHMTNTNRGGGTTNNFNTNNGGGGGGTENPTTSDDNNTLNPQSYFGTINPTDDGDDVSTLGDPYVGELITPAMDATVTSGGLMSLQEKLFVYGVSGPSSRVGSTGIESRMGDTMLTGSHKTLMFGDDTTLEAMYQTPLTTTEQNPTGLDFITIMAPSGVLGVVLNNTGVEFPVVFAVKDTSPLYGRVEVGDMLVSVDEVHCKGMSSHTVSSFLSSRSQNPGRKLTLARASVDTRSNA